VRRAAKLTCQQKMEDEYYPIDFLALIAILQDSEGWLAIALCMRWHVVCLMQALPLVYAEYKMKAWYTSGF